MDVDLKLFGRFLRPTGKGIATRYGTPSIIVGPKVDEEGRPFSDPKIVVPLTHEECARYGKEYRRAIAEGAFVEATAAEYVETMKPSPEKSKGKAKGGDS